MKNFREELIDIKLYHTTKLVAERFLTRLLQKLRDMDSESFSEIKTLKIQCVEDCEKIVVTINDSDSVLFSSVIELPIEVVDVFEYIKKDLCSGDTSGDEEKYFILTI